MGVTPTDFKNCNASPLPNGCPKIDISDSLKFSWSKKVVDSDSNEYKVTASHPRRLKSGVVGSNGMRLVHKTMLFSFQHGNAETLLWDPKVSVTPDPLPRDLKSSAPRTLARSVVASLALVMASLVYLLG